MKRLKIAFFHFGFFYEGGGERLVLKQMAGLEKRGHQTVCFTPILQKGNCYPDWINQAKIKILVPQWLNRSGNGLVIQMLMASWLIIFQFWRFFQFDVFVGVAQPGAWMAFCLAKILGKPYLVWLNQPTRFLHPRRVDREVGVRVSDRVGIVIKFLRYLKPVISFFDKKSIQSAPFLMANSQQTASLVEKFYHRKAIVNYPGAEFNFPQNKFRKKDYWRRLKGGLIIKRKKVARPFLLITNRHFPQKKFEYAIKVMPFLNQQTAGLNLVITGRQSYYTKFLKKLVYRLGLEKRVIFTGSVGEKDLRRLYQQAAVYLYTAPEEDFGMGIVEAMSAGTPVVAWDEGGPQETVVNGWTGYLVQPYNLEKFAQKIRRILIRPALMKKMGLQGRERAKQFSQQKHLDILETNLTAVCQG